jgi:hypothetical protein
MFKLASFLSQQQKDQKDLFVSKEEEEEGG